MTVENVCASGQCVQDKHVLVKAVVDSSRRLRTRVESKESMRKWHVAVQVAHLVRGPMNVCDAQWLIQAPAQLSRSVRVGRLRMTELDQHER